MYERERHRAARIVAEVCHLTRRVQGRIVETGDALAKDDRSPVTLADLATQIVVSRRLAEEFPNDPLIAEEDSAALESSPEMADRVLHEVHDLLPGITREAAHSALDRGDHSGGADRYWVLDPIDGTKGFLRGDQYAIALAMVDGGRVVVGVLGCPNLPPPPRHTVQAKGFLFSAILNGGATVRPIESDDESDVRVDKISDVSRAVFCESVEAAHAAHSVQARIASRLHIVAPPYRIDSQCKYAVVARGEASVYLRLPRDRSYREKVWDHAAGALVVSEAGGRVSDLDGRALDFSAGRFLGNGNGIVCTNGTIHEEVLAACRKELGLDRARRGEEY